MAESVIKLRVDSKDYDANIKSARQGLVAFEEECRKMGKSLGDAEKDELDFVKALGDMATNSNTTKGKLRELTQATTDLTAMYRDLSQEEKNSPFGQALAQSIDKLTQRAGDAKDAMADVQGAIKNAASDTKLFDQISGGMSLMSATFQTGVGAAKMFGVEMGDNVAVLTTLQSAMAVTTGLTQIQTAVQKESAVMQGVAAIQSKALAAAQALQGAATTGTTAATKAATIAQAALNAVANANPYVLLATAIAAVGTALWAFASAASDAAEEEEELQKASDEAAQAAEDSRQAFVNAAGSAMNSASQISYLQQAYQSVNTEADKKEILEVAAAKFKELGYSCNSTADAQNLLVKYGAQIVESLRLQGEIAALTALRIEKYKQSMQNLMSNGYSASGAAAVADGGADVRELDEAILQKQMQAGRLKVPGKGGGRSGGSRGHSSRGGSRGGGGHGGGKTEAVYKEDAKTLEEINANISILQKKSEKANETELAQLGEQIRMWKEKADILTAIRNGDKEVGNSGINFDFSLPNIGPDEATQENYIDKLAEARDRIAEIQALLAGGGLGYAEMTALTDEMSSLQTMDFGSTVAAIGKITKQAEADQAATNAQKTRDAWADAANAMKAAGGAMQQIEDPAAKVAGIIAQAIAEIALGYAQATSKAAALGPWGWVAFAATGLATMLSTISAVKSATQHHAEGGFVTGSQSGDNIPMPMLTAGELVLNTAQQSNVAAALQQNASERQSALGLGVKLQGETLWTCIDNYQRRTGKRFSA